MRRRRVSFYTLGCKLNQFESAVMAARLSRAGFEIVDWGSSADVFVINTCTVTGKTDYRSRQAIRKAQRLNPEAMIVATGCYAEVSSGVLQSMPGVHLVVGNAEKERIAELILSCDRPSSARIFVGGRGSRAKSTDGVMIDRFFGYSRAFVKIQEGCDAQCAYCIIPQARGPNKSAEPGWVVSQVRRLVESGYEEVVLCGTHLGTYGQDLSPRMTLGDLLCRILDETGVGRIRLSSIEPGEFDEGLMELLVSSKRICRHLHIPLQSGSDDVLRAMGRSYSAGDYARVVRWFKERSWQFCIGADVIVGFPTETEAQFEETVRFVEEIGLSYLHVFSYSPRPGTPAARDYPDGGIVGPGQRRRRSKRLRLVGMRLRRRFYESLVGQRVEVLVLNKMDESTGKRLALSDNYVNVLVDADAAPIGRVVQARVVSVVDDGVIGEIEAVGA